MNRGSETIFPLSGKVFLEQRCESGVEVVQEPVDSRGTAKRYLHLRQVTV